MVDPAQAVGGEAVTVILTGKTEFTDTGYWMLDAGLFVVQGAEDVRMQETRSPFDGT